MSPSTLQNCGIPVRWGLWTAPADRESCTLRCLSAVLAQLLDGFQHLHVAWADFWPRELRSHSAMNAQLWCFLLWRNKKGSSKAPQALRALDPSWSFPKLILPPSFLAEQDHWLGSGAITSAFLSLSSSVAGLCSSFQAFHGALSVKWHWSTASQWVGLWMLLTWV